MLDLVVAPGVRLTGLALKDREGPEGFDVAERVTLPEKPLLEIMIVEFVGIPTSVFRDDGLAATPKSPTTVTVTSIQ
jgi:hypothetical protein